MLSVFQDSQRELRAAVLAMKAADREIKRDINQRTRATMNPVWKSLVEANASGMRARDYRLVATGVRIKAGNPPVAQAAQSRRAFGGKRKALRPMEHYHLVEFGASDPNRYSVYDRKNRSRPGTHKVKRRASRGWRPRDRTGYVVYPAFAELGPRMVSLWVQTIVRTYAEAAERRR